MAAVSGGSGAPLRSESGKLLSSLHEDPIITFGDSTRNYVDKDLRYRTTPSEQNAYRMELDKIVEEKKRQKYNEKLGCLSNFKIVSGVFIYIKALFSNGVRSFNEKFFLVRKVL